MSTKRATYRAELKALEGADGQSTGQVEALVSVFGNVDLQGDRVMPGAFKKSIDKWRTSGDTVPVIFSHDWSDVWSHIGVVEDMRETEKGLLVRYSLDVKDNPVAAQVHRLMKRRSLKEHSFAYDIIDERPGKDGANELTDLDIIEVGPTLKGANPETELVGVKAAVEQNQKRAIGVHHTDTYGGEWDGPANEARLANDAGGAVYRRAFAWVDPEGDPDVKSSYKFIHHTVSEDGSVGGASTTACSAGIAVLNGGRGGTVIPDADRQGVYSHLAAHIRDSGAEPPALKSLDEEKPEPVEPALDFDQLEKAVEKIGFALAGVQEALAAAKAVQADLPEIPEPEPEAKTEEPEEVKVEEPKDNELLRIKAEIEALSA